MARKSGELVRCGGRWSEAQFKSFIKNQLRSATRKWAPINDCKKSAHIARGLYKCSNCNEVVPPTTYDEEKRKRVKNIAVDHIVPVIDPEEGFTSWDEVVDGLFCEPENLQLLCKKCHDIKCSEEISIAKMRRGYYKTHLREYTTYVSMKGRCTNPKTKSYKYYGGKGIKVCDSWLASFENFYKDMGPRPDGATLDRINSNGNYEPNNCRWATWEEQQSNKSSNVIVEWDGITDTLVGWSRRVNIPHATISYRLRNNFTVGEALGFATKPTRHDLAARREAYAEENKFEDEEVFDVE